MMRCRIAQLGPTLAEVEGDKATCRVCGLLIVGDDFWDARRRMQQHLARYPEAVLRDGPRKAQPLLPGMPGGKFAEIW